MGIKAIGQELFERIEAGEYGNNPAFETRSELELWLLENSLTEAGFVAAINPDASIYFDLVDDRLIPGLKNDSVGLDQLKDEVLNEFGAQPWPGNGISVTAGQRFFTYDTGTFEALSDFVAYSAPIEGPQWRKIAEGVQAVAQQVAFLAANPFPSILVRQNTAFSATGPIRYSGPYLDDALDVLVNYGAQGRFGFVTLFRQSQTLRRNIRLPAGGKLDGVQSIGMAGFKLTLEDACVMYNLTLEMGVIAAAAAGVSAEPARLIGGQSLNVIHEAPPGVTMVLENRRVDTASPTNILYRGGGTFLLVGSTPVPLDAQVAPGTTVTPVANSNGQPPTSGTSLPAQGPATTGKVLKSDGTTASWDTDQTTAAGPTGSGAYAQVSRVQAGAQALTSDLAIIILDETLEDFGGMADNAAGGIRIQEAGRYLVGGTVLLYAVAGTHCDTYVVRRRAGVADELINSGGGVTANSSSYCVAVAASKPVSLLAGDLLLLGASGGGVAAHYMYTRTLLWAQQI